MNSASVSKGAALLVFGISTTAIAWYGEKGKWEWVVAHAMIAFLASLFLFAEKLKEDRE